MRLISEPESGVSIVHVTTTKIKLKACRGSSKIPFERMVNKLLRLFTIPKIFIISIAERRTSMHVFTFTSRHPTNANDPDTKYIELAHPSEPPKQQKSKKNDLKN